MMMRRARRIRRANTIPKSIKSLNNRCKTFDQMIGLFQDKSSRQSMLYTMDLFKDPNSFDVTKYSQTLITVLTTVFVNHFPTEEFVNRCIELSDKHLYHSNHIINLLHKSGYIFSDDQKEILFSKGLPRDMFENYNYYCGITDLVNYLCNLKSYRKGSPKSYVDNLVLNEYNVINIYDHIFNHVGLEKNVDDEFPSRLYKLDEILTQMYSNTNFKMNHLYDVPDTNIIQLIQFAITKGFDVKNPKFVNKLSLKSMILLKLNLIPIPVSDEKLLELSLFYANISSNYRVNKPDAILYDGKYIDKLLWDVVIKHCHSTIDIKEDNLLDVIKNLLKINGEREAPIDNFETVRLLNDPSKHHIIINQLGWPTESDQNIYLILRVLGMKPTMEIFQMALKLHHLVAIFDCIINLDFKMDYDMLKIFIESTDYPQVLGRYFNYSKRRYTAKFTDKSESIYEKTMFSRTLNSIFMQKFDIPVDFYKYLVDAKISCEIRDVVLDLAIEYGYVTTLDNISYGFGKKYCYKHLHKLGVPMDEDFFHQMYIHDIPEILNQTWSTQQLMNRIAPLRVVKQVQKTRFRRRIREVITRMSPSDYYDLRNIPDYYTYDLTLRYNKKVAKLIESMKGFVQSPCYYYWKNAKSGGNFKLFCEQVGITKEMLSKQCVDSFDGITVKRGRNKKETEPSSIKNIEPLARYDLTDEENSLEFSDEI